MESPLKLKLYWPKLDSKGLNDLELKGTTAQLKVNVLVICTLCYLCYYVYMLLLFLLSFDVIKKVELFAIDYSLVVFTISGSKLKPRLWLNPSKDHG